jgi:hypothetical protein
VHGNGSWEGSYRGARCCGGGAGPKIILILGAGSILSVAMAMLVLLLVWAPGDKGSPEERSKEIHFALTQNAYTVPHSQMHPLLGSTIQ